MNGILDTDTKPPGRDLDPCWKDGFVPRRRMRFWFLAPLLSFVVPPASWITTPWPQLSLFSSVQSFYFFRISFCSVWAPHSF